MRVHISDPAGAEALGAQLALFAASGDCICLSGDLGAGKTTLARGLIHALSAHDEPPDVPSPTYTLVQLYDQTRIFVAHFDFYRLETPAEAVETGFHDMADEYLRLVEWPERLAGDLPADRLDVELRIDGTGRAARLNGYGSWSGRVRRMEDIAAFLDKNGVKSVHRRFLQGDASTRRYERLHLPGAKTSILMDMPHRPDGPPIGAGKPYSAIAHIAEDISAVVAVNDCLIEHGYSAPRCRAWDRTHGLAIIEDLGDHVYGAMRARGEDMAEPMATAVALLADMATRNWPARVGAGNHEHTIEAFDDDVLAIEVALLLDWFWPMVQTRAAPDDVREQFIGICRDLFAVIDHKHAIWVLRDFHSPNLIWLPERKGVAGVGLIDTQDALMGPPAYDLVSLLQDARIDIPAREEADLLHQYCRLRRKGPTGFDETRLRLEYAILGAQRAMKVLGIFARLSHRDGKHGYLRHLPRVSKALERNLNHPELAGLKAWFDVHLPRHMRDNAANTTAS